MHSSPEGDKAVDPRHAKSKGKSTMSRTTSTKAQAVDSDPARASPFLKLPAELRNAIYEHVAHDQNVLRLSENQIVLPPLGQTCKQIRTEMRGPFERLIVLDITLDVDARIASSDRDRGGVFQWLEENMPVPTGRDRHRVRRVRTYVAGGAHFRVHQLAVAGVRVRRRRL